MDTDIEQGRAMILLEKFTDQPESANDARENALIKHELNKYFEAYRSEGKWCYIDSGKCDNSGNIFMYRTSKYNAQPALFAFSPPADFQIMILDRNFQNPGYKWKKLSISEIEDESILSSMEPQEKEKDEQKDKKEEEKGKGEPKKAKMNDADKKKGYEQLLEKLETMYKGRKDTILQKQNNGEPTKEGQAAWNAMIAKGKSVHTAEKNVLNAAKKSLTKSDVDAIKWEGNDVMKIIKDYFVAHEGKSAATPSSATSTMEDEPAAMGNGKRANMVEDVNGLKNPQELLSEALNAVIPYVENGTLTLIDTEGQTVDLHEGEAVEVGSVFCSGFIPIDILHKLDVHILKDLEDGKKISLVITNIEMQSALEEECPIFQRLDTGIFSEE